VQIHCAFDHDKLVPVICLMGTDIMVNGYPEYLAGAKLQLTPSGAKAKKIVRIPPSTRTLSLTLPLSCPCNNPTPTSSVFRNLLWTWGKWKWAYWYAQNDVIVLFE
jgi:hypothetical protein